MHIATIIHSLDNGQDRFALCHQAFKAIRKLHKPGNRIQDTASDVLHRLADGERRKLSSDRENVNAAAIEVGQDR